MFLLPYVNIGTYLFIQLAQSLTVTYFVFPDSWLNVKLSVYVHTPENDDHPVEGFTAAPASTIRLKASVTDQNYIPVVNATVGVTVSDMRPWTAVQERHLPPRLLQVA